MKYRLVNTPTEVVRCLKRPLAQIHVHAQSTTLHILRGVVSPWHTRDHLCGGVNLEGVFVHRSLVHRNPSSAE